MTTPNFFGDYRKFPSATLQQLLTERGYDPGNVITNREDLAKTLDYLDSDIDSVSNTTIDGPYSDLFNLLAHLGFNITKLPSENTPENRKILLEHLHNYHQGNLSLDLLDGEVGFQTYQYAQRRYYYFLNRAKLPINPQAEAIFASFSSDEIGQIVKFLYRNFKKPGYSNQEIFLSQPPNLLIPFLLNLKEGEDPSKLAQQLGMIFPLNVSDKTKYYLQNLPLYEKIYLRPDPIEYPPPLEEIDWQDRVILLQFYTDDEIIDFYEITFDSWTSRRNFLEKVASEGVYRE